MSVISGLLGDSASQSNYSVSSPATCPIDPRHNGMEYCRASRSHTSPSSRLWQCHRLRTILHWMWISRITFLDVTLLSLPFSVWEWLKVWKKNSGIRSLLKDVFHEAGALFIIYMETNCSIWIFSRNLSTISVSAVFPQIRGTLNTDSHSIFPETTWYKNVINQFGVPLDTR